jgi:hypothetical protein
MTSRAEKLLAEAKTYLAAAEKKEREASADKWAAAERMWKAHHEEDVMYKEIADAVGSPKGTIGGYIGAWEKFGNRPVNQRPTFAEAVSPGGLQELREGDTTRTLRDAPAKTVEKIVSQLPPERQAVVARAAIRSAGDEVMADPQTRMRARAAAERQTSAAQAQAEGERKALAAGLRDDSQDAVDGRALTELGGALGRIIGTTRAAAEIWKRWEPKVSAEARDAAVDDIGNTQARTDTILDAMRGADLDAALAQILAETEETA